MRPPASSSLGESASDEVGGTESHSGEAGRPKSAGFAAALRRALLGQALVPAALALVAAVALLRFGPQGGIELQATLALVLGLAVLGAVQGGLQRGSLSRRFGEPLDRVAETVERLSQGRLEALLGWGGDDAFARPAASFDRFLDERLVERGAAGRNDTRREGEAPERAGHEGVAREVEGLNDSVLEIMQALGAIASTKDLGIRVKVTDNVTGAIAEALNLLTEETGRVLRKVSELAQEVARSSRSVRKQSDLATRAAAREQREVAVAARELGAAARALVAVAGRARQADEVAGRAVHTTAAAVQIVGGTVDGIARSRELIRETEKRIKRLGERSQEIGQVVGIIQAIAERTGILALNASMHAAAAGEAGRSFAVVADEVKRLSESARESTARIGRLVHSIQTETNATVLAMNQAITRVVSISRLADEAGEQMRLTQQETESLAGNVREIAATSDEQARVSSELQERARVIEDASAETARQLTAQNIETRRLVECARLLVDEVGVFRTPPAP